MDNNKKSEKGLLGVITVICAGLIALSIILPDAAGPAGAAVKFLVTPLQRSLNSFGSYICKVAIEFFAIVTAYKLKTRLG